MGSRNQTPESVSFSIYSAENADFTMSHGIDIVFCIDGQNTIYSGSRAYTLEKGGMVVINAFQLYRCECIGFGRVIVLRSSYDFLRISGTDDIWIECYVPDIQMGINLQYQRIREMFSKIFRHHFKKDTAEMSRELIELLLFLSNNFSINRKEKREHINADSEERIERILDYIHGHWQEDIRVSALAKMEYLSPNYLSRFFQSRVHCSLTEYITQIRILHAQDALLRSDTSTTTIGYDCGFPNSSSFIRAFRNHTGQTPTDYRLNNQHKKATPVDNGSQGNNLDLTFLLSFSDEVKSSKEADATSMQHNELLVDCTEEGSVLRHTWKTLFNVGYAHDLLIELIKDQVRIAQKEIGFRYLRFHGIFDDDMFFYHEDATGKIRLNFIYPDTVLDFVLSLGLKPFLELGYTPFALAKNKHIPYSRKSCFSVPASPQKWEQMVKRALRHWIGRYGLEEVLQWKFTMMGMTTVISGYVSQEEYNTHYFSTYSAVKSVDKRLIFGGPGAFGNAAWENDYLRNFLEFATAADCAPDFISIKNFPHQTVSQDPSFIEYTKSQLSAPSILSNDQHFSKRLLEKTTQELGRFGLQNKEIWFEEWNSNLWQRDFSGETCYKSAWIIQTICDCYDLPQAFGYWPLSDFLEEHEILSTFYGGPGLFTYQGIPKNGWNALKLLNKLGSRLLSKGTGYMVTRDTNRLQIIMYNCAQHNDLYRYRYLVLEDPRDAYTVFNETASRRFTFRLKNLPELCRISEFAINRINGSTFDEWLRIGTPEILSKAQQEALEKQAELLAVSSKTIRSGAEMTISHNIATNEVVMVIIEW